MPCFARATCTFRLHDRPTFLGLGNPTCAFTSITNCSPNSQTSSVKYVDGHSKRHQAKRKYSSEYWVFEAVSSVVELAPCLRCVRSHLVSQCARKCAQMGTFSPAKLSPKPGYMSQTGTDRIAGLSCTRWAVRWLPEGPLTYKNVISILPVYTHWHVGEEIAAAEKEALPEARGSYW